MKAYELIDRPEKWTTDYFAIDNQGEVVSVRSDAAVSFCALGAIYRAYNLTQWEPHPIIKKLKSAIGVNADFEICHWNNSSDWQTVYSTLKELDI